jgi:hypothetical protein
MERKNKMPIKVGGVFIDVTKINEKNTQQQVQPEPTPVPVPQQVVVAVVEEENPVDMTPPARKIVKQKPRPKITDGHTIVVNGREKTIGRKSQYLLDMMIIDDE